MKYNLTSVTSEDRANYPVAISKELAQIEEKGLKLVPGSGIEETIESGGIRLKEGYILPEQGEYQLDFGDIYRGKSPKEAFNNPKNGYRFVSLLQYLRLVQEYPDLLSKELYLNFVVDELRNGSGWSGCPDVRQRDVEAWLGDGYAGSTYVRFGSLLAARESTGTLASEPSALFDPSKFEINYNGKKYKLEEV